MKKLWLCLALTMILGGGRCLANGFSVSGDSLDFDMESSIGVARGNVVLEQDGGVAKGDYAQFNNKDKNGYMSGNVIADKDGYHISASSMTLHDPDHVSVSGSAVVQHEGRLLTAAMIEYYKSKAYFKTSNGRATLVDADGSVVRADFLDYDRNKGIVNAIGNVEIQSDVRNLTAQADRAVYRIGNETTTNYLELIGNAVATQDGNTVRGKHLKLNNARVAQADGGVSIDFVPKKTGQEQKKKIVA